MEQETDEGEKTHQRTAHTDKYRVYTDSTFFRYEVLLTKGRDEGRWMLTVRV